MTSDQSASSSEYPFVKDGLVDIRRPALAEKHGQLRFFGIIIVIVAIAILLLNYIVTMYGRGAGAANLTYYLLMIGLPCVLAVMLIGYIIVVGLRDDSCDHLGSSLDGTDNSTLRERLTCAWNDVSLTNSLFLFEDTIRALGASGKSGIVVRIVTGQEIDPIRPLEVPFEPVPLDESEAAMLYLGKSAIASCDVKDSSATSMMTSSDLGRQIRRYTGMQGGWWRMIICEVFAISGFIFAGIDLYHGHYGLSLLMIPVLMAMVYGWLYKSDLWLAVPGGIVIRQLRGIRQAVTLELYDRNSSVACMLEGPTSWTIAVSNGKTDRTKQFTRKEAEFFLRAWFSPIEPPTMERLSDLKG